jgi:arylsulfatase A
MNGSVRRWFPPGITVLALWWVAACEVPASTRPNLLVILADDMGWNDVSLHGSKTPTPHIDRLASSGVAFNNLVVNSVCSPTRASFHTGCDAIRSGYGGEVGDRINPGLRTIAQTFKAAGYRTGLFGKWHNGKPAGDNPWSPSPMKAGFDSFAGFYGGGTDFFTQMPKGRTPRNWHVNDRQSDAEPGYTTDLISRSAIKFIDEAASKPFFCMVAHAAPHEPFQATDALLRRVPAEIRGDIVLTEKMVKEKTAEFARSGRMDERTWEYGGFSEAERRVVYSAMMIGLDDGVGQIIGKLKATGRDQDTIVLLFSDNGAMRFIREGNLPLRGTKHSLYDGGVRVPGFLSFPKGGIASGTRYEPMIRGMDLYPTLAALAGVPITGPGALDGVDHSPALLGKAAPPEVEWNGIFVYYGGYRDNQWKLIAKAGGSELYDLRKDPSEADDVSEKFPEVTRRLRAKHAAWLVKHGANVNYAPPAVKVPHEARPAGQVLDVRWTAPDKSTKAQLGFPLDGPARNRMGQVAGDVRVCTPGDCLIYDMKIISMEPGQTAYVSPLRGEPVFGGGMGAGVNADGVQVCSTERLPAPLGEWKRHVLGLGNSAASNLSDFRLVVESRNRAKGDVHVLLDNIQVRKPDGRVIPVWTGGDAPSQDSALTCSVIELASPDP